MDLVPRNHTPLSDTALAMIARTFEARLVALEEASRAWAARPHSPEARFISTMIGTMRGFGELALAIAGDAKTLVDGLERAADTRLKVSETDLARMEKSLEMSAALVDRTGATLRNVEVEREGLAKKVAVDMSADILAEMKPHLGRAVILRERDRNWRAYGFASLAALGFVVVGIVIGVWGSSGPSLAEASIDQCAQNPTLSADGHAWCDLSHLPHVSARPAGETSPLTMGPATLR